VQLVERTTMTRRGAELLEEMANSEETAAESLAKAEALADVVDWDTDRMLENDEGESGVSLAADSSK
jgi:hypothetical protein